MTGSLNRGAGGLWAMGPYSRHIKAIVKINPGKIVGRWWIPEELPETTIL